MSEKGFVRNYFRDFSWVAAGMGGAMAVDFLFYILAGRFMSPVEFGYFGVITSLYYIFLRSPFGVLETVAKKIQAEGSDSMNVLGRKSLYLGASVSAFFLIFSGPISSLLQIPRLPIFVFSMVFPFGYLLAVVVGKVQGEEKYSLYGRYEFLGSLTAFSTLFLVYIGYGAAAATAMFVVEILAGLFVLTRTEKLDLGSGVLEEKGLLLNSFLYIVGVHAAFSLDILAVQYFFSSEVTGLYNTVAVIGKGLFFGSVAVNRSVFPKFVVDEASRMKNLILSQSILIVGGLSAVFFLSFFGEQFLTYTFGASYAAAAAYAPHYMVMISGISSVALLSNYCISIDLDEVRFAALMPVLQVIFIVFFHRTVLQIIYSTLAASLIVALFLSIPVLRSRS